MYCDVLTTGSQEMRVRRKLSAQLDLISIVKRSLHITRKWGDGGPCVAAQRNCPLWAYDPGKGSNFVQGLIFRGNAPYSRYSFLLGFRPSFLWFLPLNSIVPHERRKVNLWIGKYKLKSLAQLLQFSFESELLMGSRSSLLANPVNLHLWVPHLGKST